MLFKIIIKLKIPMQKSNLVAFLKHFSKQDWRAFRKFVRSPYFNQRKDIILLLDYLNEALLAQAPSELHRKKIYNKVYPNESFNEKKLRSTFFTLLKIVKKYLVLIEIESNPIQQQQYLCKSLRKKGLEFFFEKEISTTRKLMEKEIHRDSNFFQQKYQLETEEALFTMPQRRSGEMNFQYNAKLLNIAYISNLLRLSCNIQSRKTMSGQIYDLNLLPEVLAKIETGEYLDTPAIALYFHCYKSIEGIENNISNSEIHFEKLKKLIDLHWKLFPPSEIRDIYLFTINYCIKRLNAGERKYIREAFELFRSGLENKTLLEEGILSSFSYKNITRLGMSLLENEWVEAFLEKYKPYLHPRERDNTWRYNLAFFYFQQQKYKPAMQLLLQVEFKDMLNNLEARRILLKCYFELGEYNALGSLLDSFSRYIYRQKEIGYHKEIYLNFIRLVKKIVHGNTDDKKIVKQLKEEVEGTKQLVERKWLLEKLQQPKNKSFG